MLIDRGLLVAQNGTFHVVGSLDALEVPETLHALIAARLDSIGGSERQLLQDAAVLGKSFTAGGLRAITQIPAESVEPCLATLVNKDLLAIQSDPRSPERGQYVFVQDLVRSVAYGTLTRRDRKLRHLSAAAYLESSWTEEEGVAEVIASHLLEAFEADPDAPDAAGLRQRACDALVRAGDHAASLAAASSAEHYYERALKLADAADRATLHTRAGQMAWQQLHTAAARRHLDEAVALHTAEGRIGAAARTSVTLAAIDAHEVKSEQAAIRMERAFAELNAVESDTAEHQADIAVVAAELSRRLVLARRNLDVALERVELALSTAERHGYTDVFCEAINTKGLILGIRGRREEGRALLGCALDNALASDNHRAALRAYNNIAADLQALNPAQAVSYTEKGIALARLLGLRREEIMFTIGQLPVQIDLGHWDAAMSVIADVLESTDVEVTDSVLGAELIYGAWVHVWRGEVTQAQPLVKRLTELCAQAGPDYQLMHDAARSVVLRAEGRDREALDILVDRVRRAEDLWEYSEVARWAFVEGVEAAFSVGDLQVVRQQLTTAVQGFSPLAFPLIQAHLLRFQARLDAREGRHAEVARSFLAAMAMFEQRQMPFWVAVTRLELGEWMMQRGRRDESEGLLAPARTAFVELGAIPWIDRVDSAVQDAVATNVDQHALPA
jgi:tetratricopeptide (TPR) repeat protein